MNHNDHKQLLQKGILEPGGVWADLGSGTGAFTLALADLIGPVGHIYSVDRDRNSLREQERALQKSTARRLLAPDLLPRSDDLVLRGHAHAQGGRVPRHRREEAGQLWRRLARMGIRACEGSAQKVATDGRVRAGS